VTRFVDLSDVVPPDIQVEIRGREFVLPGDPPMAIYLRLLDMQDRIDAATESDEDATGVEREILESTSQAIYDLFCVCQPDLELDDFQSVVGIHSGTAVLGEVMRLYDDGEAEGEAERPTKAQSKKNSPRSATPKRKPTAKRSRS